MHPLRIMVVEDVRDSADLTVLLLQHWGYDPNVVYDGKHAVELATARPPSVVLLDIALPGMNGCEVARRLRQLPATSHALLVAVTGYGQEADIQRCKEAGIDLHFLKPVDPEEIKKVLETAANREA